MDFINYNEYLYSKQAPSGSATHGYQEDQQACLAN